MQSTEVRERVTNESFPDRIVMNETFHREVDAFAAHLHVTVQGSSFFSGEAAMKKAKEVSSLVDTLIGQGVAVEQIKVKSVQLESSSGTFTRTSSAIYRLKINCENLDIVPDVLGAIASAKNCSMERIEWQYERNDESRMKWIADSLAIVKDRAAIVAKALDVKLLGIQECRFDKAHPTAPRVSQFDEFAPETATTLRRRVELGIPFAQSQEQHLNVYVSFRSSEPGR
jgi:hypothetical protein